MAFPDLSLSCIARTALTIGLAAMLIASCGGTQPDSVSFRATGPASTRLSEPARSTVGQSIRVTKHRWARQASRICDKSLTPALEAPVSETKDIDGIIATFDRLGQLSQEAHDRIAALDRPAEASDQIAAFLEALQHGATAETTLADDLRALELAPSERLKATVRSDFDRVRAALTTQIKSAAAAGVDC
jgi:hypothetical protein